MKIYVDAMGGDLAPEAPVKGALNALRQYPGLEIILAGKLDEITPFLGNYDDVKDRLTLEEEPEVITNHESPVMGVRKKVNSATVQGMLKVRSGEADGFVSAGSTGATLAGGMFRLGRIPGVERPALAPLMPNGNGHFLLIDCGANVDCKPEYLVQFGIMGDAYTKGVLGMKKPRIGLVNIGAEAEKGNALVKETYPLMDSAAGTDQKGTDGGHPGESGRADRETGLPAREESHELRRDRRRPAAGRSGRGGEGARVQQRLCLLQRHRPVRKNDRRPRGGHHQGRGLPASAGNHRNTQERGKGLTRRKRHMDFETIKGMIADQLKVNPDDIKPESRLIEDLKADSANIMVMIMDLEDQFGITVEDDQIMKLKTVGDVAAYVAKAKG